MSLRCNAAAKEIFNNMLQIPKLKIKRYSIGHTFSTKLPYQFQMREKLLSQNAFHLKSGIQ